MHQAELPELLEHRHKPQSLQSLQQSLHCPKVPDHEMKDLIEYGYGFRHVIFPVGREKDYEGS